jgi:DNA polymerase III epsilon subunit-like protein
MPYLQRRMPALPCVIDIEASGLGRASFPIEVGWVGGDGRAMCTLVQPEPDWTHWDGSAERLHGITPAMLQAHGKPAARVAALLNADLSGQTVYTDAWAHDYPWLARLFDAAGLSPRFKLESVATLVAVDRLHDLTAAQREALAALGLTRHRASNDARALQAALLKLLTQAA